MVKRHISVCVCTYRRPVLLRRLLGKLKDQDSGGEFTFSIIVCDNDAGCSAESVVSSFAGGETVSVVYCNEPRQNIALARNKALEKAQGEFIAFIDDDEFPAPNWLRTLHQTCQTYKAAGVLGPVRPHFDETPPRWIVRGKFCDRPEHSTGRIMRWDESRTGNLLFRSSIIAGEPEPFKREFGTGGEDKDFFMRMKEQGHVFTWCNEAVTYETVPRSRWTRSYMLKRALLRGKNILKHPRGRHNALARSLLAVPIYTLILPFTLMFGHHYFMKYCIKFCDHLGRLLALLRLNTMEYRA